MTPDDELEAINMYLADPPLSVSAICAELGVNPPSLYHVLYKHGIPLRRTNRRDQSYTQARVVNEWLDEHGEGLLIPLDGDVGQARVLKSIEKIQEATGKNILKADYALRKPRKTLMDELYTPETHAMIVRLAGEQGFTASEISRLIPGIPYNHILKILHRAGVKMSRGRGGSRITVLRKEIIQDINNGVPLEEIWANRGVDMAQMYYLLESDPERRRVAALQNTRGRALALVEEVLRQVRLELIKQGTLIPTTDSAAQDEMRFDDPNV